MATPTHNVSMHSVLLRPVRPGNAFEETVERLLQLVKLGVVGAGERLPAERELAASFGVSRETLRDAIASLRDAGYLEARRGRNGGTFVLEGPRVVPPHRRGRRRLRRGDVDEVLALRTVLECGSAELAARRELAPGEQQELYDAVTATESAEIANYRTADSRLHLAIAHAAGVSALVALVADVRAKANDLLDGIPLLERNIAHSDDQHSAMVRAIVAGDTDGARTTMREHLEGSAALIRAFLA